MECVLGRLLDPEELVHHRNRNPADNRPTNLEVLTRSAHQGEHRDQRQAPLTEDQVRAALDGRSTAEAAAHLGVHPQTLRNRFAHLLSYRRSPGAPLDPTSAERVRALALDPHVTTRAAARDLGVTPNTLRAWCRSVGVRWEIASRDPRGRDA